MRNKTLFILLLVALATLMMFMNQDEIAVWFFGERHISKALLMGTALGLGFLLGLLFRRKRPSRTALSEEDRDYINMDDEDNDEDDLNDENRDYIRL